MAQYKYNTPFDNEEAQRISQHKVGALLGDQIRVFDSTYISRSGKTRSGLFSMKSNARTSSGGFSLEYPVAIQFLDLKYSTSNRSEKINHAFIFRRYVYGHILGSSKIGRKQTSLKRMLQISMNLSLQNILNPQRNEEK